MQQQSAKTNIKSTIKYVCSLLSSLGVTSLTPEVIRQAKFDEPGMVRPHTFVLNVASFRRMSHCLGPCIRLRRLLRYGRHSTTFSS